MDALSVEEDAPLHARVARHAFQKLLSDFDRRRLTIEHGVGWHDVASVKHVRVYESVGEIGCIGVHGFDLRLYQFVRPPMHLGEAVLVPLVVLHVDVDVADGMIDEDDEHAHEPLTSFAGKHADGSHSRVVVYHIIIFALRRYFFGEARMNAESEADRTLRNLSVLSQVKQNDKLITTGDTFAIYPPTVLRGMCRKWWGEARDNNLQRIQEVVNAACSYISATAKTSSRTARDGSDDELSRMHMCRKCFRVVDALRASRVGLVNLTHTYADDTTCKVRIAIIVQTMDDYLLVVESLLNQTSGVPSRALCESSTHSPISESSGTTGVPLEPELLRI